MPPSAAPTGEPPVPPPAGPDPGRLSDLPWTELLPWLNDYRGGPGILADDEVIANAWIDSSPARTLSDDNSTTFRDRVADRYLGDRSDHRLGDDFPGVYADRPVNCLGLTSATVTALVSARVLTSTDLAPWTADDLLSLPRVGPATVRELIRMIVMHSATDRNTPTDEAISDLLAPLNDRDRLVLTDRILAARPRTQAELAAMVGTSRERITQVDRDLRRRLSELIAESPRLSTQRAAVVERTRPVSAVAALIRELPALGTMIDGLGVPTWRLLVAGSPQLTSDDDWVLRGTLQEVFTATRDAVAHESSPEGTAPVDPVSAALHLDPETARRWLRRSGFGIIADSVVSSMSSTGDLVAAVLSIAGAPQTFEQIAAGLADTPRAASSIRNALVSDERIVKTDRNHYGLGRWGRARYLPVHRQIGQILDDSGGSADIDDVVTAIRSRYDVSEASIRAYASAGQFATHDGVVRRRDRPYRSRKSPTRTRWLYRDGSTTHWATSVTSAHLKGSAFNIPSALASIIGVGPGTPVTLDSDLGPQSFMWVSVQARAGTIKRFAVDLDLALGDPLFLDFSDERFAVRRADPYAGGSPTARILTLIGREPVDVTADDLRAILAEALWLPDDTDVATVVHTLRARQETALSDLVESVLA